MPRRENSAESRIRNAQAFYVKLTDIIRKLERDLTRAAVEEEKKALAALIGEKKKVQQIQLDILDSAENFIRVRGPRRRPQQQTQPRVWPPAPPRPQPARQVLLVPVAPAPAPVPPHQEAPAIILVAADAAAAAAAAAIQEATERAVALLSSATAVQATPVVVEAPPTAVQPPIVVEAHPVAVEAPPDIEAPPLVVQAPPIAACQCHLLPNPPFAPSEWWSSRSLSLGAERRYEASSLT